MTNPLLGLFKTILMFLLQEVTFEEDAIGKKLIMDDGYVFTIFRRVVIKAKQPGLTAYLLSEYVSSTSPWLVMNWKERVLASACTSSAPKPAL